ncbi:MAG: acetate--CoA ligase family protein [Candidatus Thermoplasmatota archaeon]|jgi:succinyl-CoA synthetase beta subunit|nr:acetate--CoA ligase family protein [Candidatus Thermoplasmatota archaeon]MCL5962751.1 acetate--CoA ligase family protein [Candidatus Thermoplasmatota archaeon]
MNNVKLSESLKLFKEHGFPVPDFWVIRSSEEVDLLDIPFPVVLKVSSVAYSHKSDVGGVVVGIPDIDTLKKIYKEKVDKLGETEFVVQTMVSGTIELIAGTSLDNTFGQVMMFGIGGIFAELMKDVSYRLIPVNRVDIHDMISELKSSPILYGYRDKKPVNIDAITDVMIKLSNFVNKFPDDIAGIDLNPVICNENRSYVVDVRLILNTDRPLLSPF